MKTRVLASVSLCIVLIFGACGSKDEKKVVEEAVNGNLDSVVTAVEEIPENPADRAAYKIVDNVIITENVPAVVDFYADWCPPCKEYKPIFEKVKANFEGEAIFISINVDKYKALAKAYGVESIPTTAFILPGGQTLGTEAGLLTEEKLTAFVNQLVAQNGQSEFSL